MLHKILLQIILLICATCSILAQDSHGVSLGFNYSDIYVVNDQSFNEDGQTIIPKMGIQLGVYSKYRINRMTISSGIGYSFNRIEIANDSPLALLRLVTGNDQFYSHFIEVPLTFSYIIFTGFNLGIGFLNSMYITDINNAVDLDKKYSWYRGGFLSSLSYDITENIHAVLKAKYLGISYEWQHPSISIEFQYDLIK